MKYTVKQLWNKACEHDGISPNALFVVFSESNPWAKKYNQLLLLMGYNHGNKLPQA